MASRHETPTAIECSDDALTRAFDQSLRAAAAGARRHLACRRGCTPCCLGAFDISALDAHRLRRGLRALAGTHPRLAAAVRRRVSQAWRAQRDAFPGGPTRRALCADDRAREAFFAATANVPCPVLNPRTGACDLYTFRPLSCRSYGLPIRCGSTVLPPCPLNFTAASAAEIAAAAVDPDPADVEGAVLASLLTLDPAAGDTTVAAALAEAD